MRATCALLALLGCNAADLAGKGAVDTDLDAVGGGGERPGADDPGPVDSGLGRDEPDTAAVDSGDDLGPCRPGAPRPSAARFVLVSHPTGAAGGNTTAWEVLRLGSDGALTQTGQTFSMGLGRGGPIRFSADGSLAVAVQDDGSLGVVTLNGAGVPTVVATSFADDGAGGAFYAKDVRFTADGRGLWVVDGNWVRNGGGVYAVDLDCRTGVPTGRGRVMEAKLGSHLIPVDDGLHVLVAAEAMASGPGARVHLVDLAGPAVLDSAALWAVDDAIIGGAALGGDGTYVLVGDHAAFSGIPNRIGVARLQGTTLTPVQVLPDVYDPIGLATWGAATLVASGFDDALLSVAFDSGSPTPFSVSGTFATTTPTLLPGPIATTSAPGGDGWLLTTELSTVRVIRASPAGGLTEVAHLDFGDGLQAIVGSVGAQP